MRALPANAALLVAIQLVPAMYALELLFKYKLVPARVALRYNLRGEHGAVYREAAREVAQLPYADVAVRCPYGGLCGVQLRRTQAGERVFHKKPK